MSLLNKLANDTALFLSKSRWPRGILCHAQRTGKSDLRGGTSPVGDIPVFLGLWGVLCLQNWSTQCSRTCKLPPLWKWHVQHRWHKFVRKWNRYRTLARVSKATFIAACALVMAIEFSLDFIERVLKIIRSRNIYLRLIFRIYEYTEILRSSWMVLKNDILESFDSLASKIGAWFLRVFALSVSHCAMLTVSTLLYV